MEIRPLSPFGTERLHFLCLIFFLHSYAKYLWSGSYVPSTKLGGTGCTDDPRWTAVIALQSF